MRSAHSPRADSTRAFTRTTSARPATDTGTRPVLVPGHDSARAPHVGTADRRVRFRHLAPLPVVRHGRHLDAKVGSYVGGRPPLRGCVRASPHGHHSGIKRPRDEK